MRDQVRDEVISRDQVRDEVRDQHTQHTQQLSNEIVMLLYNYM